jgi:hypothetical protein
MNSEENLTVVPYLHCTMYNVLYILQAYQKNIIKVILHKKGMAARYVVVSE